MMTTMIIMLATLNAVVQCDEEASSRLLLFLFCRAILLLLSGCQHREDIYYNSK